MDKEIQELLKLAGIGHKPVEYKSNIEGEHSPLTVDTIEDDVEEDFLKPAGEQDMYDDEHVEENAFNTARDKAIAADQDEFEFEGETYPVTDVDSSDRDRAKDRFDEDENSLDALWQQFQQVAISHYPDADPVEVMLDRYDVDMDLLMAAAKKGGYDHPMDWVDELDEYPTVGPKDQDAVVYDTAYEFQEDVDDQSSQADFMIKFDSEEAHDLIDELFGVLADRGIEGEMVLPPRLKGTVEAALADAGFQEDQDYHFVDPMHEVDLQNGYQDQHCVDADDYFTSGATGPAPRKLGPGAASQGDNPLATSMRVTESTDLFEKYLTEYQQFKLED